MAISEFCQHVTILRNDVIKFWSFLGGGAMCWRFSSNKCCTSRQYCLFTVGSDASKKFWQNKIVFKAMTSSTCPILDKNCQFQRLTFCVWRKNYVMTQIPFKTIIHVYSVQPICQTRNLTSKLQKPEKLKKHRDFLTFHMDHIAPVFKFS